MIVQLTKSTSQSSAGGARSDASSFRGSSNHSSSAGFSAVLAVVSFSDTARGLACATDAPPPSAGNQATSVATLPPKPEMRPMPRRQEEPAWGSGSGSGGSAARWIASSLWLRRSDAIGAKGLGCIRAVAGAAPEPGASGPGLSETAARLWLQRPATRRPPRWRRRQAVEAVGAVGGSACLVPALPAHAEPSRDRRARAPTSGGSDDGVGADGTGLLRCIAGTWVGLVQSATALIQITMSSAAAAAAPTRADFRALIWKSAALHGYTDDASTTTRLERRRRRHLH